MHTQTPDKARILLHLKGLVVLSIVVTKLHVSYQLGGAGVESQWGQFSISGLMVYMYLISDCGLTGGLSE